MPFSTSPSGSIAQPKISRGQLDESMTLGQVFQHLTIDGRGLRPRDVDEHDSGALGPRSLRRQVGRPPRDRPGLDRPGGAASSPSPRIGHQEHREDRRPSAASPPTSRPLCPRVSPSTGVPGRSHPIAMTKITYPGLAASGSGARGSARCGLRPAADGQRAHGSAPSHGVAASSKGLAEVSLVRCTVPGGDGCGFVAAVLRIGGVLDAVRLRRRRSRGRRLRRRNARDAERRSVTANSGTTGWPPRSESAFSTRGRVEEYLLLDTVLLLLCVGLTLLGVIATGIAWRRGNKGRVVQGVGLALAPIALYFSGLLRLLWDAMMAIGNWASKIIFSPAVWFGLSPCSPTTAWSCGWSAAWSPAALLRGPRRRRRPPAHRPRPRCRPRARRAGRPPASRPRSIRRWPRSRRCSSPAVSSESFRFVSSSVRPPLGVDSTLPKQVAPSTVRQTRRARPRAPAPARPPCRPRTPCG